MDSRLLWFAVGVGAVLVLQQQSKLGAGLAGTLQMSFGGNVKSSIPTDQQWQVPTDRDRIGVWDPMGNAAHYKDVPDGSSGNQVNTGGGLY